MNVISQPLKAETALHTPPEHEVLMFVEGQLGQVANLAMGKSFEESQQAIAELKRRHKEAEWQYELKKQNMPQAEKFQHEMDTLMAATMQFQQYHAYCLEQIVKLPVPFPHFSLGEFFTTEAHKQWLNKHLFSILEKKAQQALSFVCSINWEDKSKLEDNIDRLPENVAVTLSKPEDINDFALSYYLAEHSEKQHSLLKYRQPLKQAIKNWAIQNKKVNLGEKKVYTQVKFEAEQLHSYVTQIFSQHIYEKLWQNYLGKKSSQAIDDLTEEAIASQCLQELKQDPVNDKFFSLFEAALDLCDETEKKKLQTYLNDFFVLTIKSWKAKYAGEYAADAWSERLEEPYGAYEVVIPAENILSPNVPKATNEVSNVEQASAKQPTTVAQTQTPRSIGSALRHRLLGVLMMGLGMASTSNGCFYSNGSDQLAEAQPATQMASAQPTSTPSASTKTSQAPKAETSSNVLSQAKYQFDRDHVDYRSFLNEMGKATGNAVFKAKLDAIAATVVNPATLKTKLTENPTHREALEAYFEIGLKDGVGWFLSDLKKVHETTIAQGVDINDTAAMEERFSKEPQRYNTYKKLWRAIKAMKPIEVNKSKGYIVDIDNNAFLKQAEQTLGPSMREFMMVLELALQELALQPVTDKSEVTEAFFKIAKDIALLKRGKEPTEGAKLRPETIQLVKSAYKKIDGSLKILNDFHQQEKNNPLSTIVGQILSEVKEVKLETTLHQDRYEAPSRLNNKKVMHASVNVKNTGYPVNREAQHAYHEVTKPITANSYVHASTQVAEEIVAEMNKKRTDAADLWTKATEWKPENGLWTNIKLKCGKIGYGLFGYKSKTIAQKMEELLYKTDDCQKEYVADVKRPQSVAQINAELKKIREANIEDLRPNRPKDPTLNSQNTHISTNASAKASAKVSAKVSDSIADSAPSKTSQPNNSWMKRAWNSLWS